MLNIFSRSEREKKLIQQRDAYKKSLKVLVEELYEANLTIATLVVGDRKLVPATQEIYNFLTEELDKLDNMHIEMPMKATTISTISRGDHHFFEWREDLIKRDHQLILWLNKWGFYK